MKMDGFGKFFDQPSCEFGGKYMEVRGGETNTNTNRKKDTNRNYFVTLFLRLTDVLFGFIKSSR